MKGALPWLVRWACRSGTRDFFTPLATLVGPVQNIFFITIRKLRNTLFQFFCPHRPASRTGRSAGSPVSYYVSLVKACFMKSREAGNHMNLEKRKQAGRENLTFGLCSVYTYFYYLLSSYLYCRRSTFHGNPSHVRIDVKK
jgi:hypothetical protein